MAYRLTMRVARPAHRILQQRLLHQHTPLRFSLQKCSRGSLAAGTSSSAICISHRHLSQQGRTWLNKLRYGADDAPTMGSWDSAYEDDAMNTRKLYCKALVYASGGSRLARDWIAGCAALTSPDPSLIYTALQHAAAEADVRELRDHILGRLLAQENPKRGGRGAGCSSDQEVQSKLDVNKEVKKDDVALDTDHETTETASASDCAMQHHSQHGGSAGEVVSAQLTAKEVLDAEMYLLQRSPEVHCFMYDTMTASLFHSNNDLCAVEMARRHTFCIGSSFFGLSFDDLTELWRVVEAEMLLKKEKIKILGQPWGE